MNFLLTLTLFLGVSLAILIWLRSFLHPIRKARPVPVVRKTTTSGIGKCGQTTKNSKGTPDVDR